MFVKLFFALCFVAASAVIITKTVKAIQRLLTKKDEGKE